MAKLEKNQTNISDDTTSNEPLPHPDQTQDYWIAAFKIEFAEFLNEDRFFKVWSDDREPRYEKRETVDTVIDGFVLEVSEPLLEEYVDGIHILLQIGLGRGWNKYAPSVKTDSRIYTNWPKVDLTNAIFCNTFASAGLYITAWMQYLAFGQKLGFTEDEIVDAYMQKNKVNHKRQDTGY